MRILLNLGFVVGITLSGGAGATEAAVPDPVTGSLLSWLHARFPEIERFELMRLTGLPHDAPEPAELEVQVDPQGPGVPRRLRAMLRRKGSGSPVVSWWRVRAQAQTAVLGRSIRSGESVTTDDVRFEWRDIAGMGETFSGPASVRQRGRLCAAHLLVSGAVLRARDVVTAPEVARDQPVRVKVSDGPVVLDTTGIVRDDGRLGQRVRVLNPLSGESYVAHVSGVGEVSLGSATR